MANSKQISKEKSNLIKKLESEGRKDAYNEAGRIINQKYGKGWREKHQTYDEWFQERNMDGSFAYDGITDDF